MAGSVSPANSRVQGILFTVWWNPRPDAVTKIVTLPAIPWNLTFGSPEIVGFICARSFNHERMMPMHCKHLNLATSDVAGLTSFFEQFFGFKRLITRGRDAFILMSNQDDFVLTLMKAKQHDPAAYPESFHVGFYVGTPDVVQAKHDELSEAGLAPGKIQDLSRGGNRVTTFYCTAPGGIVVEIATPPGLTAE
jgi:catechol 2,3-dioxygenase-like lactoylglutathione lyase family enzyme